MTANSKIVEELSVHDAMEKNIFNIKLKNICMYFALICIFLYFVSNKKTLLETNGCVILAIFLSYFFENKKWTEKKLLGYTPYSCLIAPILEEITFRVFLVNFFNKFFDFNISKVISSMIFGISHLSFDKNNFLEMFGYFITSSIFGYILSNEKCFISKIILHIYINLFITLYEIFIMKLSGPNFHF